MQNIRRSYFYALSFVSLEAALWGIVGLLRTVAELGSDCSFSNLSFSLALSVVSVPIFILHWRWAQNAEKEDDDHSVLPRAIFLYAVLSATSVPVIQNILAFINRVLIDNAAATSCQPFIGGNQSWQDNFISIGLNLVVAGYVLYILNNDEEKNGKSKSFITLRHIYHYAWVFYGMVLMILGLRQILTFLLFLPNALFGGNTHSTFINGLALILVGVPVWIFSWRICQNALEDPNERDSAIRRTFLFLLSFAGLPFAIILGYELVDIFNMWLLGGEPFSQNLLHQISGTISLNLPITVLWVYYGLWLKRDIEFLPEASRRNSLKDAYAYPISAVGLVMTFVGVYRVFDLVTQLFIIKNDLFSRISVIEPLAKTITTILVGIALWVIPWYSAQKKSLDAGEIGAHARRSATRKIYLYLIMFASIVGIMIATIGLIGGLLNSYIFISKTIDDCASDPEFYEFLGFVLQFLIPLSILFYYHFRTLRRDSSFETDSLAELQEKFAVLILNHGDANFMKEMHRSMKEHASHVQLIISEVEKTIPEETTLKAQAVILSSKLLIEMSDELRLWLRNFTGQKILVEGNSPEWTLKGLSPTQAAKILRQIAEGEKIRIPASMTVGKIILYVMLGIGVLMILSTLAQEIYYLF